MMEKLFYSTLLIASALSFPAMAYEPVRFEDACTQANKVSPLRQTIVVVDEGALRAKDGAAKNDDRRWIRAVVELADAREGVTTTNMEAGERLSILVARADGSELVPLFFGCSPNLSRAELLERQKADSVTDKFFGRDTASVLKKQVETFEARILTALTQVTKQTEVDDKASRPIQVDGFLRALQSGGRLVDSAYGVPRFLMITDLRFANAGQLKSKESARKAGFDVAANSNIDLARAEVNVLNLGESGIPALRDFADALLLGSKGLLVGWRTDGLPPLQAAPVAVRYFGGSIDYAGLAAPIQIRLAFDRSGVLVNSWVEVTLTKAVSTPIAGKAICQGGLVCEVKGDGKQFAQSWNVGLGAEPRFGEDLPFAGFRYIELSTSKDDAAGRVFDPKARIRLGADSTSVTDDFRFNLKVTPGQIF